MMPQVIELEDLAVSYRHGGGWVRVLHSVSFTIARGEVLGLVGESGCGKSTVALQLLGHRSPNLRVDAGTVRFAGRDLLKLPRPELDRIRGDRIGFVPQNPTTALNPSMRVGAQVAETLFLHRRVSSRVDAEDRTARLFALVGLPEPRALLARYPHELSGGQQQRVCIANAAACDPDLIVLDEPTTGLDVTTQQQIIALLLDLKARLGTAMLYVTHDLALLAQIADRVGVMYAGHLVETAPAATLFHAPLHPYSRGLIASLPRIEGDGEPAAPLQGSLKRNELPEGCAFAPRCGQSEPTCWTRTQILQAVSPLHAVACQRWREPAECRTGALLSFPAPSPAAAPLLELESLTLGYGGRRSLLNPFARARPLVVVDGFSAAIGRGETLALVGESGSGKSTVARAGIGLLPPIDGRVLFEGKPLAPSFADRQREERRRIQLVFQNPDASLNPRATIGRILARPIRMFFGLDAMAVRDRVGEALREVRLDPSYAARYPDELSGGERQRVAIARALAARPDLLLCDEVLSALDVSVQANIVELLRRLRAEHRLAILFISHDLAVVRSIADRVAVMFRGRLMEIGRTDQVFAPPFHPYTHALLTAVPSIRSPRRPSAVSARPPVPGSACAFAGRCPWQIGAICEAVEPPWQKVHGHAIRCHLSRDELLARAREAALLERRHQA